MARSPVLHPCGAFAYHKGQYHRTIGLQSTPTHCERANQHPFSRLQGTPTQWANTAEPQAKSKQTPTLIAPQAQTQGPPAITLVAVYWQPALYLTAWELLYLCFLNTARLGKLNYLVVGALPTWTPSQTGPMGILDNQVLGTFLHSCKANDTTINFFTTHPPAQ